MVVGGRAATWFGLSAPMLVVLAVALFVSLLGPDVGGLVGPGAGAVVGPGG